VVFKGPTSKGKEGKGEERREREGERKGKRGEGRRKGGEGRTTLHTPVANSWLRHWYGTAANHRHRRRRCRHPPYSLLLLLL